MSGPKVPRNDAVIQRALARILEGVTVPQGDLQAVVQYMNEELPRFEQADVSYLVLGSYRDEYGIRLRKFAHRLNMPTNAASIVLGDTIDLETTVLPEFDIKINLLGEAADYIAGVYEKEAGGESPELGFIRALFVEKTFVFPRDYTGLDSETIETRDDVLAAAVQIYFAEGPDDARREGLLSLLTLAQENGIVITERELTDLLKERKETLDEPPAEYSWVHLSLFKRFDVVDRCHPWTTLSELLDRAELMPGPSRPRWEHEYLDDFDIRE